MPPKPTWFHRLPEILDVLRGMDATHLVPTWTVRRSKRSSASGGAGPGN